jgi:nitroreductase
MEESLLDTLEAIFTRTSIRAFTDDPVTDDLVDTLLKAMIAAPSGGNRQPWRIFVIRNPDVKHQLARGAGDQEFVAEAPVVFVVCRVPDESGQRYGSRGRNLYSIQDTAAMTQNLLLAAHAIGLGGCWVGAFKEEAIATAINTPASVIPVAIIPIGKPATPRKERGRKSLDQVVHFLS